MEIKIKPLDAARYFPDASQIDVVTDVLVSGDPDYLAAALGFVARARGMTPLAGDTGVSSQALSDALGLRVSRGYHLDLSPRN